MNVVFISKQQTIFDEHIKIRTETNLDSLKSWLTKVKKRVIDTETTGLDPYSASMLTLQIGDSVNQFIVDLRDKPDISELFPLINMEGTFNIGANLGFDYKMLRHHYNFFLDNIYDVSRADEVIFNGVFSELDKNPTKHKMLYLKTFGLAGLCKRHLNIDISKKERKNFVNRNLFKPFTTQEVEYMALDCIYPDLIYNKQERLIKKYNLKNCVSLENQVVLPVADMEYNGIGFNRGPWNDLAVSQQAALEDKYVELDEIILNDYKLDKYTKTGYQLDFFTTDISKRFTDINWDSNDQVLQILQEANFKVEKTDKRALIGLSNHKLISTLLKTKELAKSVSTYGLSFLKWINPKTGRIHPNFLQLFPDTGRLSCMAPNLQNIKRGSSYRDCFIPRDDFDMLTYDYSGQELRLIAHASQDPLWLEAFRNNEDLHSILCMKTFGIDKSQVKTQFPFAAGATTYRDIQKSINFMLAFGGSEHKLAEVANISIERAKKIIDDYFSVVPHVKRYLYESGKFAQKYGYSRTFHPIGRIRWYSQHSQLNSMTSNDRNRVLGEMDRMGKNTPIQGTGADLVKLAMVNVRKYIKDNNLWKDLYMLLQVHDELVTEGNKNNSEQYKHDVEKIMVKTGEVFVDSIPMEVSATISNKWNK